MTDRQFVRQYYPNAELQYWVRPINTMRAVTHYTIISDSILNEHKTLGKGWTSVEAWKNAKKKIKLSNQQYK